MIKFKYFFFLRYNFIILLNKYIIYLFYQLFINNKFQDYKFKFLYFKVVTKLLKMKSESQNVLNPRLGEVFICSEET